MRATYCNGHLYRKGRFEASDFEVVDGRISSITPRQPELGKREESPDHVDLGGAYVIPGLVDAHAHLVLSPDAERHEQLTARVLKGARNARIQLEAGVTAVRDVGGPGRIALDLKDAIEAGVLPGPRVSSSGSFISITGGHVSYWGREADGADDVRRAVREQRKAGADFIKIMASGGVADASEDPSLSQYTRSELEVICQEASSAGTYVAAHAHPAAAIRHCLEAGVRTIEHASFLDEAGIEIALTKSAYIVPTFIVYEVMARSEHLSSTQRNLASYVLERKSESFMAAVNAGVMWGVGTDAGSFMPQGQLWQEMLFIHRLGVPADEVIKAATLTNAEIMRSERLGRLEPGSWADAVVFDSDPTMNLDVLKDPSLVIKGGRVVHRNEIPLTIPTVQPGGGR